MKRIITRIVFVLLAQIGKPAPQFSAANISGTNYSLSDFKGKVVLLDLWASGCAPCRALTPYLKTLSVKYGKDADIVFTLIGIKPPYSGLTLN